MSDGPKPSHSAVPNRGWHFREYYPSDFNRLFGHLLHRRLIEHYVRSSDDLPVLGVPESISDLTVGSIPEENAFP